MAKEEWVMGASDPQTRLRELMNLRALDFWTNEATHLQRQLDRIKEFAKKYPGATIETTGGGLVLREPVFNPEPAKKLLDGSEPVADHVREALTKALAHDRAENALSRAPEGAKIPEGFTKGVTHSGPPWEREKSEDNLEGAPLESLKRLGPDPAHKVGKPEGKEHT